MIKERLRALHSLFADYHINGYIVPSNDEYMSEYTPLYAKRLEYITGFTGSNGIAIILENSALFFTDGRYLEQCKYELDTEVFQICDLKELQSCSVSRNIQDGTSTSSILGYDPKLFTTPKLKTFSHLKSPFCKIENNLIDQIWSNKPAKPLSSVYIHELEFAGQTHSEKIAQCRETLTKHAAVALVITSSDSICWLLNLRAQDVPYSPMMLSYVILTNDQLYLFTDPTRVTQDILNNRPEMTVLPEEELSIVLKNIEGKVLADENFASSFIMDLVASKRKEASGGCHPEAKLEGSSFSPPLKRSLAIAQNDSIDPCQILKARKNAVELQHAANFHVKDAVALCEFFAYLAELENLSELTEYDLGLMLTDFRSKQDGYVMDSFSSICGFKGNGAIIHYRAKKETAQKIAGNGLLLIDSGGQYKGATTDVTRTIAIGPPTDEQKKRYTQVLKGHIALASARFPVGTTGAHLDVLARQFLWRDYQDYPHGTGHGVGSFLSVHEGPQNISQRSRVALEAGMIISNEPGYYKAGEFGIRIENLMYVKQAHPNWLEFETLTLVPYAKELIDYTMLETGEIKYIKQYYQKIMTELYPLVSERGKRWLGKKVSS